MVNDDGSWSTISNDQWWLRINDYWWLRIVIIVHWSLLIVLPGAEDSWLSIVHPWVPSILWKLTVWPAQLVGWPSHWDKLLVGSVWLLVSRSVVVCEGQKWLIMLGNHCWLLINNDCSSTSRSLLDSWQRLVIVTGKGQILAIETCNSCEGWLTCHELYGDCHELVMIITSYDHGWGGWSHDEPSIEFVKRHSCSGIFSYQFAFYDTIFMTLMIYMIFHHSCGVFCITAAAGPESHAAVAQVTFPTLRSEVQPHRPGRCTAARGASPADGTAWSPKHLFGFSNADVLSRSGDKHVDIFWI